MKIIFVLLRISMQNSQEDSYTSKGKCMNNFRLDIPSGHLCFWTSGSWSFHVDAEQRVLCSNKYFKMEITNHWYLQFKKHTIQKTDIEMDYLLNVLHICNRRIQRFTNVYILIIIFIMNGEIKIECEIGAMQLSAGFMPAYTIWDTKYILISKKHKHTLEPIIRINILWINILWTNF